MAALPNSLTTCWTWGAVAVAGSGAAKDTVTGYGNCLGHFQKTRPPWKLKTLPQSRSRCTGMTRGSPAPQQSSQTPFEGQYIACPANRPLSKNADHVALLQGLTRLREGSWRLRPTGNRNRLHQAKQPAQGFDLINWAIDKETDEAGHTGPYEEAVNVGDMIADEQRWPLRRDMFPTHHTDAIESMRQHPTEQADDKGW